MDIKNVSLASNLSYQNIDKINQNNSQDLPHSGLDEDSFISSEDVIPGEFIVKFNIPISSADLAASAETRRGPSDGLGIGAKIIKKFDMPSLSRTPNNVYHIKLDEDMEPEKAVKILMENSNVVYAEPNFIINMPKVENLNNINSVSSLNNTKGTKNYASQKFPNDLSEYQLSLHDRSSGYDIDAPEAWVITTGKREGGPLIAVIDSGVDIKHLDLVNNIWTNQGEIPGDGIDNDRNGYIDDVNGYNFVLNSPDVRDSEGHGTHCAGIIGAEGNNSMGITGVNWKTNILPLKVVSGETIPLSASIDAINYATKMGVDIISASWSSKNKSKALAEAISAFPGLFVAAAGNYGENNDFKPRYPASFSSKNIISVASSTYGHVSDFSNYGRRTVDIAAPGDHIGSTLPGNNCGYETGTSMAAPHVTGVAALIMSEYPELSALEVKEAIMKGGHALESGKLKVKSGKILNANGALLYAGKLDEKRKA